MLPPQPGRRDHPAALRTAVPPDPATGAPAPSGRPSSAGTVFTSPSAADRAAGRWRFVVGVRVGAAAALAGALVGGWIAGRRR